MFFSCDFFASGPRIPSIISTYAQPLLDPPKNLILAHQTLNVASKDPDGVPEFNVGNLKLVGLEYPTTLLNQVLKA